MSRRRKRTLVGLAITAGAVLGGVLLLILLFPTDLIRDRAVAAIEQKLQRPVKVGAARLALFPSFGADLTDVQIGDQAEPGRPRFAAASLHLRVRLLPLLGRRVEITRVEIERLEVEALLAGQASATSSSRAGIVRDTRSSPTSEARAPATSEANRAVTSEAHPPATRAGTTADEAGTPHGESGDGATRAGTASMTTRPFHFKIEALAVRNGSIRVRTADGGPLVDLGGIFEDLEAEATSAGDVHLAGHTRIDSLRIHLPAGDLGQGMRLRLEKLLRYDRASDSLTVEKADLDLSGLPVSIRGGAADVSSGHPTIGVDLEGGPGEVSDILGYLPSAVFPQMEGIQSSGTMSLQASVRGPLGLEGESTSTKRKLDFRLVLTLSEGRIVHPRISAPIEGIGLHATLTPQSVDVTDFTASSGTSRLKAKSKVSDYRENPTLDAALDVDLDLRELAAMQPRPGAQQMQGRAAAQLAVRGPVKDANRIEIAGIVDLRSVGFEDPGMESPVENVSGRILLHDRDLTLEGLSGKMGSSDFAAQGTISNYRAIQPGSNAEPPAKMNLTVRSGFLALDELFPAREKKQAIPDASGGTPSTPAMKTAGALAALTGTIDFSADRIRTKDTETGAASAVAKFDRGLVRIERCDLEVFGGKVAVQGTVDYRRPQNPQFDLKAQAQKVGASDLFTSSKSLNSFSRMAGFLSGKIDANANFKGDLNETQDLNLGTLTSIGDLAIHGAKITNHPLQVRIADFLETPQLNILAISDWFQPFRIENGRLIVERLSIKSQQIEVSASGWQSLDGKLEMGFDILVPQELSAGIRKRIPKELVPVLFDGTASQILVPMRVSGSYDSPSVAVDTDRLTAEARAQAQRKLAAERQRLEEEARRRAQGFLDGLVKTPPDTSSNKEKANEIENKIKKSLKDLFKKKK